MRMARLVLLGIVILATASFGVRSTLAAEMGMGAELKTAITHAGYAANADTTATVTMHLHHVINCLVGPTDKMFDKAPGNPCAGQGNGILPDIKAKMGEDQEYQVAWWMARLADEAISMGNLQQAKAAAHILEVQLTSMAHM